MSFKVRVTKNGDTHVLISKSEFMERWAELTTERGLKTVTLHANSNFGGTSKHESITLNVTEVEDLLTVMHNWAVRSK